MDLLHTLQHAIDIAKETFPELKDVERQRIRLEVYVLLKDQQVRRTAEIGRTAWPFVIASLARFEIMEIRVAPPMAPETAFEPPPYAPEKSGYLQPPSPPSLVTRIANLITPKSSRSRLSP